MKKGDKVEVISNIPVSLLHIEPLLGTIEKVDGYTFVVKLDYQDITGEWYETELKLVDK